MKILALETSAKAASCAVSEDGARVAFAYQNSGLTHSRTLMPMVRDMLRNAGLGPGDIGAVACAVGPGSFTGLRIGVAAAKGFAWAGELPCAAVSTLEAMAAQSSFLEGIVCPVMDARRGQFYNALFECGGGSCRRLCPDRAIDVGELADQLAGYKKTVFLVGDGALLCYNMVENSLENVVPAPEALRWQTAWGVALCAEEKARRGELCTASRLEPVYLRLSQAERERLERLSREKKQ